MQLNRDSLFYKFLSFSNDNQSYLIDVRCGYKTLDVCALRWMAMKAAALWLLIGALLLLVSAVISLALGDFIAFIVAVIMFGHLEPNWGAAVIMLTSGVMAFLVMTALATKGTDKIAKSNVGVMYRSWRDKYCEKVGIV